LPVTMPVVVPTGATAVELVLHVPPDVALDNVSKLPTQTDELPVMAAGNALTVMSVVLKQPVLVN
jgi:hypothetical protein